MAGPADTAIGRIYNFCSVCLEVVCIGLGREKMTLVGLAQALIGIVAVQCSRSLSGTDDGSTLTFHPVPGSVPASSDYEHMTSPPPDSGTFPSQLQCHTWFRAIFHHQTCWILGPSLILQAH